MAGAAPPDLNVTFRPMFGGVFAYVDGKPFASLSDVGLALKFAGSERDALLAVPGAEPLRYEADQPASKSYVVVPESMLSQPDQLRSWVIRSASALPAKRVRKQA
ncbi:TfoX/Sxy family protein [Sphingomonas sp. 37zxx]|uniref:TfoX/Sxy family protein n=1 Tax=Sphingomonas sp. 37zxx TaxID=1550073 RepID=UPI0012E04103|nr:TfoX/Sxy family protein [Sphingomonas sp. 37zxx]